jgi:hypothetical protein
MRQCWDEVEQSRDTVPLRPNWPKYKILEDAGMFRSYTMETDAGELVGFCVMYRHESMHSIGTFIAANDTLYVLKPYRKYAVEFRQLIIDDLTSEKVNWISFNLKDKPSSDRFASKLGLTPYEKRYEKGV